MPKHSDSELDISFMHQLPVEEEPIEEEPHVHLQLKIKEETEQERERKEMELRKQQLDDKFEQLRQQILGKVAAEKNNETSFPPSAASGGYLARPSNIYADSKPEVFTSKPAEEPVPPPSAKIEDEESFNMQLVIRNDIPAADMPTAQTLQPTQAPAEELREAGDIAAEEKRKAAERLQKLRNLSFNLNAVDPNNEFEAVPAYIRRNMELYNQTASVENFYSNYSVKPDGNNTAQISTINTFLDGKKPD
jgi:cell division protein FtsZ